MFSPKVVVKESAETENTHRVTPVIDTAKKVMGVEDLLPNENDGISERVRLNILNGRNTGVYKKALENAWKLHDFKQLIKESEELPRKLKLIPRMLKLKISP